MQLSRHFYAIGGILVVLSAASLGAGGKTVARTSPLQVVVTNTTSNPVNTKAVGTTQVSGSVSISGAVTLNNTTPIVVHDDGGGRTPVMSTLHVIIQPTDFAVFTNVYTVPQGYEFVLQTEAISGDLSPSDTLDRAQLFKNGTSYEIPISYSQTTNNPVFSRHYQGVSTGTYYFAQGEGVDVDLLRSDPTNSAAIDVMISGYLVPMPVS